jgi:hypothetical protein
LDRFRPRSGTPVTKDRARRRRLRQDRAANVAILAGLVAGLAALLAWMGLLLAPDRAGDHANPAYWSIMLPLVIWGSSAAYFEPWALRLLRPVLLLAPLSAALALWDASGRAGSPIALWSAAFAVSVTAALIGWLAYGRSLLAGKDKRS